MTKPTLYVSGPMTGKPDHNRGAFESAARDLRARGYDVVSPHELDHNMGVDLGSEDGFDVSDADYEMFMARDLAKLEECDGVVFLDGWSLSGGAGREGLRALELGIQLYLYREERPLLRLPEWLFNEYVTTERRRPAHV